MSFLKTNLYHVQISELSVIFFFLTIHDRNYPEILGFSSLYRQDNFGVSVALNTCLVSKFFNPQNKIN